LTKCSAGHCAIDTCTDYGGTCPAEGAADGTCVADFGAADGGFSGIGFCLQGGTSSTTCNATSEGDRCAPSTLCIAGWACTSSSDCEQLCEPSGANSCPSGEACTNVDGYDGVCEAEIADGGGL
jgi:hypothetical protein